jgi:integrase
MGLGRLSDFGLEEARERARRFRQLLADGIDPITEREAERREREQAVRKTAAIPTFKDAAERYVRVHGPKWKNQKHTKQFLTSLRTYAHPKLGHLAVNVITTEDTLAVLEPIWHKIPETASRLRGRIENVLSLAIAKGYREGPNPARWADNLEHLLPAKTKKNVNHHAALPYAELPAFMAALKERDGIAARALEFTILTAARTGEAIGARHDEIDLKEKTWTVPANRIKGGKKHRVPLADHAIDLLKALPTERGNDHVFIGPRKGAGLSNMSMSAVLKRMGYGHVTVHGMRSTFRDWAAERTNAPNHVVEMALAHVIGSDVEAAYRRGDLFEKRKRLMTDWAKFAYSKPVCTRDNVVTLRREGR